MTAPDLPLDEAALDDLMGIPFVLADERQDLIAQARAALTLRARVAELESLLSTVRMNADAWESEADSANTLGQSWMKHANALREALTDCFEWFDARADVDHQGDPMRAFPNAEAIQREHVLAALASTPAASLAAHDAEFGLRVVSECAMTMRSRCSCSHCDENMPGWKGREIVERALAAHPAASLAAHAARRAARDGQEGINA